MIDFFFHFFTAKFKIFISSGRLGTCPNRHLIVQGQQCEDQNNVWILFKFNIKDTRKTSKWSFQGLCYQLWTNFIIVSSNFTIVSIVNFGRVNVTWAIIVSISELLSIIMSFKSFGNSRDNVYIQLIIIMLNFCFTCDETRKTVVKREKSSKYFGHGCSCLLTLLV